MAFTHLHVHTGYSLLDGSGKIPEMVARAKELGMNSLAITDHGAMYGAIDFYKACDKAGIKAIIGCEVYVAPGKCTDKENSVSDERYRHMVLLAENNEGYQNLIKIVSKGFTEGFYYKPRVDDDILRKYNKGIIALSACLAGEIPRYLVQGRYDEALASARKYNEIFGEGNFFLELQDHGISDQATADQGIIRLHNETGIPLVVTNDVHYTYADDAEAHDILLCIQTQKKVKDTDRMRYEGGQFYLKSEEEMRTLFPAFSEAYDNTQMIADRCNVTFEFNKYKLPHFDVPEGYTSFTYLKKLCDDGIRERYADPDGNVKPELLERLKYELDVISTMGFVDYFLIVWDFIHYAKVNGIPVGPGRGSGAGSIVAYSLKITDIDPIQYNLVFERFLNPERVTMPDIDIDFCYERRQEVIDYVNRKYGSDHVVQIVTFGTLQARGVIRDVGRALDFSYAQTDKIAKMIPMELGMTIDKALESSPDLKAAYDGESDVHYLIEMAKRLEGLPRHTSKHAAGVVIAPAPVDEFVPLSRSADDYITTQYTMTTIEELGLLKMDFLGLRTLTVIDNTVKAVRESGKNPDFDINKIDYIDKKVYDLISSGQTTGIFQLESSGMTGFMKELKPHDIEDIIAGIALYRPGPMDFIPKYLQGKQDPKSVTYECEELVPILSPTYGCIVYQEQVMQIVRDLAGYSFGRSDLVRRAMSKKKAEVMARERQNFVFGNEEEHVPGCISKGISEATSNRIFDEMTDFAKYAFNKAHAACYAVVGYQTAYLKTYYPVEFMAALMTSVIDNSGKTAGYILKCRQMGIKLMPPDVNAGGAAFRADGDCIRYALSAIKGVGNAIVNGIEQERNENGPFSGLKDFITRMTPRGVNKKVIESLIKAGAFDSLPGNRRQKLMAYTGIIDSAAKERKDSISGQMSLFDLPVEDDSALPEETFPDVQEFRKEEILSFEKELLGIYVSGHPLDSYSQILDKNVTATSLDFMSEEASEGDDEQGGLMTPDKFASGGPNGSQDTDIERENRLKDGEFAVIGGIIAAKSLKTTKNNTMMAFLTVEDMYGTVEVVVFAKDFEKHRGEFEPDRKVLIRGRVSVDEDKGSKLLFSEMVDLDDLELKLWIKMADEETYLKNEQELLVTISEYDGNDQVIVYTEKDKQRRVLPNSKTTDARDRGLLDRLYKLYGEDNVKTTAGVVQWGISRRR
ncbi:MAG: DNA polymerase III subunit alpha [Lachnospiraceae bacterium]|nr:DNA polymerase III subunit alpha [Lachnospiraceae bacterium]